LENSCRFDPRYALNFVEIYYFNRLFQ